MDLHQKAVFDGIPERRVTSWHNPTKDAQRVVLDDGNGRKFLFTVQPGETKELDSAYDRAIQMIDCGKDECHKRGWFCRNGHEGLIVGGGAPLLRRANRSDKLDPSLDPVAVARKSVEAQIAQEVEREKILTEARERRTAELEQAAVATKAVQAAAPQQAKR